MSDEKKEFLGDVARLCGPQEPQVRIPRQLLPEPCLELNEDGTETCGCRTTNRCSVCSEPLCLACEDGLVDAGFPAQRCSSCAARTEKP